MGLKTREAVTDLDLRLVWRVMTANTCQSESSGLHVAERSLIGWGGWI